MSELMPWHQNWLIDIEYNRVDLVKEGANSQAHIKLFKSKGGNTMELEVILKSLKPEHADVIRKALTAKDEQVAKSAAEAKEAIEKSKAQPQAPSAEASDEEILKSVQDPAVRAILEKSIAKTKAAETIAKQLQDAQDQSEAIVKAREVSNLGAEETQLTTVYKKLKAVDVTLAEDVFGIFKAASALVKEGGVFQEVGKSTGGGAGNAADENAAWTQIEKAAEEIAKEGNISKAASVQKAINQNPELYATYIRAQQG